MKFGTLLELNSNIEWFDKYVDYDGLKKMFPAEPFEPSYRATRQDDPEASPLLTAERPQGASEEDFTVALDRERNKVVDFYKETEDELQSTFKTILGEVRVLEEREFDDVIQEEDEDEDESDHENSHSNSGFRSSQDGAGLEAGLPPRRRSSYAPASPQQNSNKSFMQKNLATFHDRFLSTDPQRDEADLLEASLTPQVQQETRARSRSNARRARLTRTGTSSDHGRRASDENRRMSASSASSNGLGPAATMSRNRGNLGLIPMIDPTPLSDSIFSSSAAVQSTGGPRLSGEESEGVDYIWTASSDYGKVLRIGFKKRIARMWLDGYALKGYVELNMTAFEKILKKYDKNTGSKLKKRYIDSTVTTSYPWQTETKNHLEETMEKILYLYARVAAGGDLELAKQQLRAQLREKIVVDRETIWSKMVSERRQNDNQLKVVTEGHSSSEKTHSLVRTPLGSLHVPTWLSWNGIICVIASIVLIVIIKVNPFDRQEESNCLAMLVFCTLLWATEAIPLFVTSFFVPFLTVALGVLRTTDGKDDRMPASDAAKYIFSVMFSPTIGLLLGGFTIAAVLSKTRLDVMTASRVLNAAGSKPSVVLLTLMCIATFASMWISNVAAPTLCYALIKPITDELPPKSAFSRCLIIAIALASNIGGQASPISSPQNLIGLAAMDPPLSWLQWFAISLPVATVSVVAIWSYLHIGYRWERDLSIPRMRKNTDPLTWTHYYVLFVTALTIVLWCIEKKFEAWVGDMGVVAIIPIIAFFGPGILSKQDFHSFQWSIVFIAMSGSALGKAVLSSGLLDDLNRVLEKGVEGMGLFSVLLVFACISLVVATFISHTIAAVLLVPIAEKVGEGLADPHPRLLIMCCTLICSAGMGLPQSGFPNITAIAQENKLGQRYIAASDFLKNGIPASILATAVIVTLGFGISKAIGL